MYPQLSSRIAEDLELIALLRQKEKSGSRSSHGEKSNQTGGKGMNAEELPTCVCGEKEWRGGGGRSVLVFARETSGAKTA